ncbi:MAG: hypothetical protein EOO00_08115 [Chitinophagaceae bacterium]|nr:MAG: hypothetical protein EOO00_08115 [Chitinophagaceae bacterium]
MLDPGVYRVQWSKNAAVKPGFAASGYCKPPGREVYSAPILIMKYFLIVLLISQTHLLNAQPVLIATDNNPKKYGDGYAQEYLVDQSRSIDGLTFFITPNWRLFQTDGTPSGTKELMQFPSGSLLYLKAVTRGYIYYTRYQNDSKALFRIDRSTLRIQPVNDDGRQIDMEVGYTAMYTSPSKDEVAIRRYKNSFTMLSTLHDSNKGANVESVIVGMSGGGTTLINIFSDVAFLGRQVFYNGHIQYDQPGTDQKGIETMIQGSVPTGNPAKMAYDIFSMYNVRSQGFELYDGFYRLKDSLFTFGFYDNKQTKKSDLAIASLHWSAMRIPAVKPVERKNIITRVIDDELYFTNGRQVLRWHPGLTGIEEVFLKDSLWPQSLQPGIYLLKSGQNLVFRERGDVVRIYNMSTRKFSEIRTPDAVTEPNSLYKYSETLLYTTKNGLYYMANDGPAPVFTRYDPETNKHEPIVFPTYKNEKFRAFRNVFQAGNKFYFLTEYTGKKDVAVYRIFVFE